VNNFQIRSVYDPEYPPNFPFDEAVFKQKQSMNIFNIRNQLKFTRWVDNEHISITKIKFNALLKEKGSAEAMLVDEEFLERERSST
jgi:hypothetical protein